MTIEFTAIEFETASEALQWTEASGCGAAVLLDGRNYVMERAEAERLAAAGVEFAHRPVVHPWVLLVGPNRSDRFQLDRERL
jgi:hypothetical protein